MPLSLGRRLVWARTAGRYVLFAIVEHNIVLGSVVVGSWIDGGVLCVREKGCGRS
jgi:hypothetical protein